MEIGVAGDAAEVSLNLLRLLLLFATGLLLARYWRSTGSGSGDR